MFRTLTHTHSVSAIKFVIGSGDIDNFGHSLDGNATKSGSKLHGNIEDAEFSIAISFDKGVMTLITKMTGGDENKAYSIKVGDGDGGVTNFVGWDVEIW